MIPVFLNDKVAASTSGQQAVHSFLMALRFLGSLLAYGVGLAVARPAAASAPR